MKFRKKFWQEVVVKFQERERSKASGNGVGTIPLAADGTVGTVGTVEELESRFTGEGKYDDVKLEGGVVVQWKPTQSQRER